MHRQPAELKPTRTLKQSDPTNKTLTPSAHYRGTEHSISSKYSYQWESKKPPVSGAASGKGSSSHLYYPYLSNLIKLAVPTSEWDT